MALNRSQSRIVNRRGSRDDRSPRVARTVPVPVEGTLCVSCGSVYRRKTWRLRALPKLAWMIAPHGRCPACVQVARGRSFGEVRLRGDAVRAQRVPILRRLRHVAARAAFTQPERRIVSIRERTDGLDVLTTSQKLAHRIAIELCKAFGGRAHYQWSDRDGRLLTIWTTADAANRS